MTVFKFRMVVLVWSKLVGDEAAYSASCVQTFSGSKRDALPDGAARQCALLQRERETQYQKPVSRYRGWKTLQDCTAKVAVAVRQMVGNDRADQDCRCQSLRNMLEVQNVAQDLSLIHI